MKVNGWGYDPRGDPWRVECPHCTATLEFGEDEILTVRFSRLERRTLRCARCKTRIDLEMHRPKLILTGPTPD